MSEIKVLFNDIELTQFIIVTDLDRGVGSEITNNLKKIGVSDGKYLKSITHEEKIISMDFALIENVNQKRRSLAGALSVATPAKLIFSDEPDKYYLAVPDGDIPLDEISFLGKGKINWLVPDGVAYSDVEQSLVANDGLLVIDYEGTAETYPRFEVVNHSDNGFLGFISQEGELIQLGNPDDVDTVPYQRNETAIHEFFREDTGDWKKGIGVVTYPYFQDNPNIPNRNVGDWDWTSKYEVIRPIYVETTEGSWGGMTLNRTIPANSNGSNAGNFINKARFNFVERTAVERGRLEIVLQTNDSILAAAVLRDSTYSKKELILECWVMGNLVKSIYLDMKKFSKWAYEMAITRVGNEIQFKLSSISQIVNEIVIPVDSIIFTHVTDSVINKPITSATLWAPKWSNSPVNEIEFTDFKFEWVNVDKLADVPNLFTDEDVVLLYNDSGVVTLNGVIYRNIGVIGNEYFTLKKGENRIQVMWSDWAVKPDVTIFYRERWL